MYKFDEKKHAHTFNGKPLYGVTTVLGIVSKGDGLIQWSANEAVKYIRDNSSVDNNSELYQVADETLEEAKKAWVKTRNTAGSSGTDVHALVEMEIRRAIANNDGYIDYKPTDAIITEDETSTKQVKNFLNWALSNNIKFLHTELNTWSLDWWVGGIVDFVYEKDGKTYIGDIKTAKAIYPINFIQTSAYGKMLIEQKVIEKVDGMTIVLLSKDGTFQTQDNFDYEGGIRCFEACLTMYKHLEAIKPN